MLVWQNFVSHRIPSQEAVISECLLIQSYLDISKLIGLFFTSSNYPKCKFFALRVIWTCKKVSNTKLWLERATKMYF